MRLQVLLQIPSLISTILDFASLAVAGSLSLITYLYYKETKSHTKEMKKTRKAEIKPVLKPGFVHRTRGEFWFAITNTGRGFAHDVYVEWCIDDGPRNSWGISSFSPGETHVFTIELDESTSGFLDGSKHDEDGILSEIDGILSYSVYCEDIEGEPYCDTEKISLSDILEARVGGAEEIVTTDKTNDILEDISKSLN